jgi:hypothetical protein
MHHRRTQFPVGEGFFHAGSLSSPDGQRLTYVYDGGSQSSYARSRRASIDNFQSRFIGRQLDLLYLSHAHADHVNGVPDLLDGLAVGTVVMPFLGAYERLVAFARSLSTEAEEPGGFFEDWVVDPVATVADLGADRVVVVRPTTPGPNAPAREPEPEPNWEALEPLDWDDGEAGVNRELQDGRERTPVPWDFVGPGVIALRAAAGTDETTTVLEVPDTIGIRPMSGRTSFPWLLATHVSPSLDSKRQTFFRTLARQLGSNPDSIESDLQATDVMRQLVVEEIPALLAAYRAVRRDVNLTSMSLYSGPTGFIASAYGWASRSGPILVSDWCHSRSGWLGTGDAKLSSSKYRKAFLAHFSPLLGNVGTATLAHHGAQNGFSDELLEKVPAQFWIAPAAPYHGWQHPHPEVERAVEYAGRHLIHVDGDNRSVFEEDFCF